MDEELTAPTFCGPSAVHARCLLGAKFVHQFTLSVIGRACLDADLQLARLTCNHILESEHDCEDYDDRHEKYSSGTFFDVLESLVHLMIGRFKNLAALSDRTGICFQ